MGATKKTKKMPFPPEYQGALESKKKNMTLRVDAEVGKYKEGEVYEAHSYDGVPWGVRVRVTEVTPMGFDGLLVADLGIPMSDVLRLCLEAGSSDQIDVIRFEPVSQ